MEFRLEMNVEIEAQSEELSERVPVSLQLVWRGGRWQAQCMEPPFATMLCETLEEALVQAAKEGARELAAAHP